MARSYKSDKQSRHTKEKAILLERSYFFPEVDVDKLYDTYKRTGELERTFKGHPTNIERILTKDVVGFDFRPGKKVKGFKIHYSNTGAHLVPWGGEQK